MLPPLWRGGCSTQGQCQEATEVSYSGELLPHFSRQDSSPSFSNTSTCPILKNEAFLESLQHGQCGIAKI